MVNDQGPQCVVMIETINFSLGDYFILSLCDYRFRGVV